MKTFKKRGKVKSELNLNRLGAIFLLIIIFEVFGLLFFSKIDIKESFDLRGWLDSEKPLEIFVRVSDGSPPDTGPPGGGGGGGIGHITKKCQENWTCNEWSLCKRLGDIGLGLNQSDKNYIQTKCNIFDFNESSCGFKFRFCRDKNNCKTNSTKPEVIDSCYYVYQSNCSDGIKNNDEEGIDCGGSCKSCEAPKFLTKSYFWIFILILFALAILLSWMIILFYKRKKVKVMLMKGQKCIGRVGYINKDKFESLKTGNVFTLNRRKYRLEYRKEGKAYAREI